MAGTRAAHNTTVDSFEYPDALLEALESGVGPLAGQRILEGGAGTGAATRALAARGANVIGFDRDWFPSVPGAHFLLADGNRLPIAGGAIDVCCFAQAWHWLDPFDAVPEVARVLRRGGSWAAWWSYPRADGEAWFDEYQGYLEMATTYQRKQRDIDWGREITAAETFGRVRRLIVPWTRRSSQDAWMRDEQTASYVALLPADAREQLMRRLAARLRAAFGDGDVVVPYETWLWVAPRT